MADDRINVIYIHSHDTGRYVQPYGYDVPTPNIQRLAEEGVLFRQAFCAAPTCSPSRACLLTGQTAHSCGQLGLANRGFNLRDTDKHIVQTLKQHGYISALFGIQHLHSDARLLGYDLIAETNSETGNYDAAARTQDAVDFLGGRPQQPFFMTVGYFETHRVFPEPGDQEDPRYTRPPAPLPDTPETREDMAAFQASARILDENIGRVLDALATNGLAENTLVICTTDHGLAFPGMKCTLTDHGMGVMLILRGPGGFSGGKVVDGLVSQIDLYPTICELAGVDAPEWLQGKSMVPLVQDEGIGGLGIGGRETEAPEINQVIFGEVNYHAAYQPQRAARTRRWKYIRHYGERLTTSLPNIDDGPSKFVLMANGLPSRKIDREQLFDLLYDPNEANNLAADPAYAGVLAEMQGHLNRWMLETDDPLLYGPVPAPEGAIVNRPDDLAPGAIDQYGPPNPWTTRGLIDDVRGR